MDERELEIITLKARAYDLIAMKEQAERELGNVNNQLIQVLNAPVPEKKEEN